MKEIIEANSGTLSAKAVTYESLGGAEIIKIVDRTVRIPEAGEVRIRVKAAGVNPTDALLRKMDNPMVRFPVIPGTDAAGVIESVGPGVSRFKIDDEVMAVLTAFRPDGGAQVGYIVVPAASVVLKPQNATFAQAAGLPMNGLTALRALELTQLRAGQTIAITGGAGVLAHYTIAVAKRIGLIVIADAKPEDYDRVRSYGADFVIKRGDDFADLIRQQFPYGVDGLVDTAVLVEKCFPAIRDGGIYISVRRLGDIRNERDIKISMVWVPDVLENTEGLELLKEMVETGEIKLKVEGEYPPEQVFDAQQTLAAGGLRGRPVILF